MLPAIMPILAGLGTAALTAGATVAIDTAIDAITGNRAITKSELKRELGKNFKKEATAFSRKNLQF